jgi:DNA primase
MPRVHPERNRELLDMAQFSPEAQRQHGMDLKQLKQRLSLLDYLRQQNWTLRPAGNGSEFVGLCPLHPETHPSFYVNAPKNLFYCHGCGQGGDLIRFVELFQHLSFRESLVYLERQNPPSAESAAAVLEETTAFYQRQLQDHEEARLYLEQRGVRDPALIQELRIGYARGGNLRRHLTAQGFSFALLRRTGLVNQQGFDSFYHRVVFPCCREGRVVNLYGRSFSAAFAHRFLPGSRGGLFAWEAVCEFPAVILVEGLFDLAVLWQVGLRNTTCSFGTHLTSTQLRQLAHPPGRQVFLAYDQDENQAGQRASQALARQLRLLGADVFLVTLPNGEDPNSYFVHGASAADFARCLQGAQPL